MKKCLIALSVLVLVAAAGTAWAAGPQSAKTCLQLAPTASNVVGNGDFEVLAPGMLEFRPDVEFQVVNDAEVPFVEFLAVGIVATKKYCRCADPTTCPDNDCYWYDSGQVAECRGGCRQSNGTVCLSCDVFDTAGTSGTASPAAQ